MTYNYTVTYRFLTLSFSSTIIFIFYFLLFKFVLYTPILLSILLSTHFSIMMQSRRAPVQYLIFIYHPCNHPMFSKLFKKKKNYCAIRTSHLLVRPPINHSITHSNPQHTVSLALNFASIPPHYQLTSPSHTRLRTRTHLHTHGHSHIRTFTDIRYICNHIIRLYLSSCS